MKNRCGLKLVFSISLITDSILCIGAGSVRGQAKSSTGMHCSVENALVRYDLASPTHVVITVTQKGDSLKQCVIDSIQGKGAYVIDLQKMNLAAGVYTIEMSADSDNRMKITTTIGK
ncbi:MAG: hypothetical protein JW795_13495 [Chitinivibrionales bacterium]|nr:hypothetical protein [Chitinivibrionales bacterium]